MCVCVWEQILCLAEQIQFTEDVESAICEQNLHQLELELTAKLEHYTDTNARVESAGAPARVCSIGKRS